MNQFTVTRHGHSRFWAVRDVAGELVCLCVYKRGAVEVARRLQTVAPTSLELHESTSAWTGEAGSKISMDSLGQPTPPHRSEAHDRSGITTKPERSTV
ncbi:MAG TPA: hypothetical protein PKM73_21775 [Verrucomicrobiota bacterium]|nr:hypothetical protein [Verrucomicrobiota bacterium]